MFLTIKIRIIPLAPARGSVTNKKRRPRGRLPFTRRSQLQVFDARDERANLSAQSLLRHEIIDKLSPNSNRLTFQTSGREDRLPRRRHRRSLQQRMT